jgi:hypothetical protein
MHLQLFLATSLQNLLIRFVRAVAFVFERATKQVTLALENKDRAFVLAVKQFLRKLN